MKIYHMLKKSDWDQAKADGFLTNPSLKDQGFIHASTREQTVDTANRFYQGFFDLYLLQIDTDRIQPELRFEPVTIRDQILHFPHIYGKLNLDAVDAVLLFSPQPDGVFTDFPDKVVK